MSQTLTSQLDRCGRTISFALLSIAYAHYRSLFTAKIKHHEAHDVSFRHILLCAQHQSVHPRRVTSSGVGLKSMKFSRGHGMILAPLSEHPH